jgi:hypothetical protein
MAEMTYEEYRAARRAKQNAGKAAEAEDEYTRVRRELGLLPPSTY